MLGASSIYVYLISFIAANAISNNLDLLNFIFSYKSAKRVYGKPAWLHEVMNTAQKHYNNTHKHISWAWGGDVVETSPPCTADRTTMGLYFPPSMLHPPRPPETPPPAPNPYLSPFA